MPIQFQSVEFSPSYIDKEVADYYDRHNITRYENTLQLDITYPSNQKSQMGLPANNEIEFWWDSKIHIGKCLEIRHIDFYILGIAVGKHNVKFNSTQSEIRYQELNERWDTTLNSSYFPEMSCDHIFFSMFVFPTNESLTIEESWFADELSIYASYDYHFNATNVNAWNVVFDLLAFQNPNLGVGGVAGTILNYVIAVPIWVITGLAVLKLVQSMIPFIKGVDE